MVDSVSAPRQRPAAGDVRERLLAAALKLLQAEGFQALTQARVAEAAGVRQSHLTYYFRTRNDLLKAVVEEGTSALLEMMSGAIRPGRATLAKFRDALLSALEDRGMPRLLIALTVASDEDPALKAWFAEFDRGVQGHLAATFRQFGLDPSPSDLVLFHAAMIGTAVLSQHAGAEWSHAAHKIVRRAFDRLVADSRAAPKARTGVRRS